MGKTVAVIEELSPDGAPLYVIVVDGKRLVKSGRKEFVEGLAVDFSKVVDDLEASYCQNPTEWYHLPRAICVWAVLRW